MLTDGNRLDAVFALGGNRFEPPQQPDLHVEMIQFARRDGRETRIFHRRADRRTIERIAQRDRLAQIAATASQLAAALEADEGAVERCVRCFGQYVVHRLRRP